MPAEVAVVVGAVVDPAVLGTNLGQCGSKWVVERAVVQEYDDAVLGIVSFVPGVD